MLIFEVLGLRVPQVNLQEELLHLTYTKTGHPRLIPMSLPMIEVFTQALARRHITLTSITDDVFLSDKGNPFTRYVVS